MRKRAQPDPVGDDFMTRAIHRMHDVGIISTGARDRMLADPMPEDPHQQIGVLRALLSVAIWRDSAPTPSGNQGGGGE